MLNCTHRRSVELSIAGRLLLAKGAAQPRARFGVLAQLGAAAAGVRQPGVEGLASFIAIAKERRHAWMAIGGCAWRLC